ncbi:MAG: ParB/RepB/Spo0J family partition protein [Trueperaceae bacterium]|nr:ParB/RepB/Spo0J family partition protein [Trueperaceae bacterium]
MSAKRSGLGRGLDALLPRPENNQGIRQISLDQLHVSSFQPRKFLDPEAISDLAKSISDKGILQPLLVRESGSGFEIVAGERRFRAAQQVGLKEVPVIVKELSDRETLEIAIIENLQRENLNPVEEALAFKQLQEFGMNQEDVAKAVGKSRSAIANTLRLLQLPERALEALKDNKLSAGHARAILAQPDEDRDWALDEILRLELSVRQSEQLKRPTASVINSGAKRSAADGRHDVLETELSKHVGTKVKISGGSKGKLELFYYSNDELERILELLGYQA